MKDPKDKEVRREVGWIGDDFVELVTEEACWRFGKRVEQRNTVTVLVITDVTFTHPARDQLEAQLIFDTLEQRLNGPVTLAAQQIHEGVI